MALSRFLTIPPEIRDQVYEFLLHPACNRTLDPQEGQTTYHYDFNIYLVNRQVYDEARSAFRRLNTFARIETPFPETHNHIAIDNNVPIVTSGEKAEKFNDSHLEIKISAPQHDLEQPYFLLIHVDDIESFCEIWYYSAISSAPLNAHLKLVLSLRNPYAAPHDDNNVPKALQKRLLEPFGMVKRLGWLEFLGNPYPSIEKSVRDAMEEPYESKESCMEKCNTLKTEGNTAIKEERYEDALECYMKAFKAMHVVCIGHRRSIWAEAFFQGQMGSGTFEGQHASILRITMRVKLVANVIFVYNKMKNWEEAKFWGMRTITLMREMMRQGDGDETPYQGFPGHDELGKIYYRTGVALKALNEKDEARRVLKVAVQYLPRDLKVQQELTSLVPRI